MIKHELLSSFQLVVKLGGISKAAEKKCLSAMAMSKQMSNLEAQLGQSLFEKTGRKMKLTEFGEHFLAEADKVLVAQSSLDNWLQKSQGEVSGTLKVVSQSTDFCKETIIPWLAEFMALYPDVNVALDVKESLIDLKEDEYDVFWGISRYLGDQFPNLKRRALWRSTLGIYASPDYLRLHGTPESVDDLSEHYVIGYLYNQPANVLLVEQNNKPVYKFLKQRVTTVTGLVELAINGLGLINVGNDVNEIGAAVSEGKLVQVLPQHWWQEAEVYVYFHNVRHPQPKVSAFIDFFLTKRKCW